MVPASALIFTMIICVCLSVISLFGIGSASVWATVDVDGASTKSVKSSSLLICCGIVIL